MMFCSNCGAQLADDATSCSNCGAVFAPAPQQQPAYYAPQQQQPVYSAPQQQQPTYSAPQQQGYAPQQGYVPQPAPQETSGLATAAKIFMIISTVIMGLYLIPLAWCLPMTISYNKKIKNNQPIGIGFKICCLLFVSVPAGIFMLCDKNN